MTETVSFPDKTQTRTIQGALARPAAPGPGVIVVHEWWGLNDPMRKIAERLAGEGFLAMAIDLYRGEVTADPKVAMGLAQKMKTAEAMEDIAGAVQWFKADPGCAGRVGITGFCLGGGMALAAACKVEGLSAAAPFYGLPLPEFATWATARCPIQGHYGLKDGHVGPDRVEPIWQAQRDAGLDTTLYWYDAGHAFMREGDPAAFHAESASLAWGRLVSFLRAHLAGEEVP